MAEQVITDATKVYDTDFGKSLNVRIINAALDGRLPSTIGELKKLSDAEILLIPELGRKSILAIRKACV